MHGAADAGVFVVSVLPFFDGSAVLPISSPSAFPRPLAQRVVPTTLSMQTPMFVLHRATPGNVRPLFPVFFPPAFFTSC